MIAAVVSASVIAGKVNNDEVVRIIPNPTRYIDQDQDKVIKF